RYLDLGINLEHVAIRVTEKQRAVAPCMIGWPRDDVDAPLLQRVCTHRHFIRSDAESQLQRQVADGWCRVVEENSALGQGEDIGSDPVLEPRISELAMQRKPHCRAIELAHRLHRAREGARV